MSTTRVKCALFIMAIVLSVPATRGIQQIGFKMNEVVMTANGGRMPVIGADPWTCAKKDERHICVDNENKFSHLWLADWIKRDTSIYSPGDFLIEFCNWIWIWLPLLGFGWLYLSLMPVLFTRRFVDILLVATSTVTVASVFMWRVSASYSQKMAEFERYSPWECKVGHRYLRADQDRAFLLSFAESCPKPYKVCGNLSKSSSTVLTACQKSCRGVFVSSHGRRTYGKEIPNVGWIQRDEGSYE